MVLFALAETRSALLDEIQRYFIFNIVGTKAPYSST